MTSTGMLTYADVCGRMLQLYLFDLAALGNKLLTNRDAPSIDHYLTLRGHSKEG